MKYKIILADPPWRFRNWSMDELTKYGEKWAKKMGRSPYPVMTTEDICKLPIRSITDKNAICLMWATSPKMKEAFLVMEKWGFEFKTIAFTWVKLNPSGQGFHTGLGYHTRQNAEFVLLGTKGKGVKRVSKKVHSLILYPRGIHSKKPPIYDRIEALYGKQLPRVELFARNKQNGWDSWGNEIEPSEGTSPLYDYIIPIPLDEDEYIEYTSGRMDVGENESEQPQWNFEQLLLV